MAFVSPWWIALLQSLGEIGIRMIHRLFIQVNTENRRLLLFSGSAYLKEGKGTIWGIYLPVDTRLSKFMKVVYPGCFGSDKYAIAGY
jgi:hypothetical protein